MAEVLTDTDAGRKRRLPIWMLKKNSADEVANSKFGSKRSSHLEEEPKIKVGINSTVRKHSRILREDMEVPDKSENLQRCEARQRVGKATRRDVFQSTINNQHDEGKLRHEDEIDGGEVAVNERAAQKKHNRKSKRRKTINMEISSPGRGDNEVDLTVGDMMSIAQEYVNADREKQHKFSTIIENQSEPHASSSSASSRINLEGPVKAVGSAKALSRCTTQSRSPLMDSEGNKNKSPSTELCSTNITRTGDAAQYMLDLFLGPLLNKPPAREEEHDAVDTISMTKTHVIDRKDVHREGWREEEPLMKKKSSLKDKVALFLS
ncbi:uncharacterized protein [Typha angustifolia]|uniref:uncharacterized protein n=1 Tax=Typha angustifolia TaxID=59011 RepID=UPI003C2BCEF4